MTASAADDDTLMAELLEELAARLQAGEPIDVEACARQHPAIADRLRWLLPVAQALANLSRPEAAATALASVPAAAPLTGTLGDFCLLREVGRGGMGVVYEAEQISLGRRVALKVLPFAGALAPRLQRRFQNEARAAACLHHPNIVPVHAVGADRGVHYYAMQFIDGQTLAALIQDRRRAEEVGASPGPASTLADRASPGKTVSETGPVARDQRAAVREVARLGVQAAEALDHAHGQGVVHRDIKPANLMVDAEGRLWVTDFGLAHVQGDGGMTATGDVLGTLRYMSPEQALARRELVDHRTDLYSLGVTLYELLTLRPAVPGEDRQELLQRIAHEEPVPARRLNPAVPVDLDTVLGRAMAKEPSERYATARELANDLQRFLDDRPVLARRPTLALRLRKWARRHRALVVSLTVSAALLLLGGVSGLAAYAVQQHEVAAERDRAARDNERQKREVEGKLYRALLTQAAALRRERQPGYRREVWESLREAGRLKVATDGGAAIRAEVLACLGDPIGLDPVRPTAVVRRAPPAIPEVFRKAFKKLQERWPEQFVQKWDDVVARPWAVSPGGRFFAHLLKSGVVWIWYRGNASEPADPWPYRVLRISFPDGNYSSLVGELPLGHVHDLKFTPDGTGLVVACDEGIALLAMFPEVRVVTSFRAGTIISTDVHPGGRLMATGGRQVNLWSLTNHRLIASFPAPAGARVEFSADGRHLLALVAGSPAAAWPVTDAPESRFLESHQAGIPAVAFSPDGKRLASVSKDKTVRLWDTATGRLLHTCRQHRHPIEAVAFSPDGQLLASGDTGGEICLWDPQSGLCVAMVPNDSEHKLPPGQIWRLHFSPGGTHLIAAGGRGVAAWGLQGEVLAGEPRLSTRPVGYPSPVVYDLAVHPDGEAVFMDKAGRLQAWTVREGDRPRTLGLTARQEMRTLHFDGTGKRLTFLTPRRTLAVLDWPGGAVRDTGLKAFQFALSPDGRYAATSNVDQEVVIYDLAAGREVLRLPSARNDVWGVAWSRDDRLAVGLSDGGLVLWDLKEVRARLREFRLPEL
jgi:WD40 repeat protein